MTGTVYCSTIGQFIYLCELSVLGLLMKQPLLLDSDTLNL